MISEKWLFQIKAHYFENEIRKQLKFLNLKPKNLNVFFVSLTRTAPAVL
jgi:hypothetical protein